jgi:integrase
MKLKNNKRLREFESPLPHTERIDFQSFSYLNSKCAKSVPMEGVKYKGLKLVKGKRWYVEYYYEIIEGLRHEFNGEKWKRIRVFEELNRLTGARRERYANQLFISVQQNLENGYNPLSSDEKYFVKNLGKSLTMKEALAYFKENITEKGVDKDTSARYIRVSNLLEHYLQKIGKEYITPDLVDEALISECLQWYKKNKSWSNRHYNNVLGYLSTVFNYLKKRGKISINPCIGINKLNFVSHKHRYYDDKTLKLLMKTLEEKDAYLRLAALFVYYAGVRSSKELLSLQVGDILVDRDRIRFRGSATKGKRDDYIFLDPILKKVIVEKGILNYPAEYHVFSIKGEPDLIPASDEYLQKHFRKIRRALGLSEEYTLYSMKHTRAVHLLMDGAQPVDIMQLFRHNDLGATTKYIRDLGFDLNTKFADKSRSI